MAEKFLPFINPFKRIESELRCQDHVWRQSLDPKQLISSVSLVLVVMLASTACAPKAQNSNLNNATANSSFQVEAKTVRQQILEQLNITMIPSQDSEEQAQKREQLADYLEELLGIPVNFQISEDYDQAVDWLVEGKVEMAFLGPFAYVKAQQRNPQIEPIVAPIEKGTDQPWYKSVIVVNGDSGINTVEDLKGRNFSFVNQSSTSGYLVPSVHLKMVGIDPEQDFVALQYAGSHNKNVEALVTGKVEAITINQPTYLNALEAGKLPADQYKLIWESDPIPNAPVVISSQLSPQLKTDLQKALIDAPKDLVAVSGAKSDGYTLVQDEDYDPIRKLQQFMEPESASSNSVGRSN